MSLSASYLAGITTSPTTMKLVINQYHLLESDHMQSFLFDYSHLI